MQITVLGPLALGAERTVRRRLGRRTGAEEVRAAQEPWPRPETGRWRKRRTAETLSSLAAVP